MATIPQLLATALEHHQGGRLQAAERIYRQILAMDLNQAEAIHLLGVLAHQVGNLDEALACWRRALELKPDLAVAHSNLGNALRNQGKLDEAVASYRRALELKPDFAAAHYNLGLALRDQAKLDEAIACYRRALELKPDYAEALNNLGNALRDQGKLEEAVACLRRALELKPDFAAACGNLGVACKEQGKLDEALACFRRAMELKPDFAEVHSNLLYTLHYCPGVTPAALAEAHAEFDRRHAGPLAGRERGAGSKQPSPPAPLPGHHVGHHVPMVVVAGKGSYERTKAHPTDGRLRLGFVSPDLGRHPVGYFLVRVLENLGHEQHVTICYSDRIVKDDLTHRLQSAATQWRDVFGLSDRQLAEQIRADRIDILFDLTGHTAHNRMLAFARKPAPIQITWIGYEGTTGLAAMDYLLADRYLVPQGSDKFIREHVLRMPDGYLCYDPPGAAPPGGPLPAMTNGYATFGSFNNPAKITPEVVAVWAEILRRLPDSRLVLKYSGMGDRIVRQWYLDLFAAHDVAPQKLELLPASSYAEYLATYRQVDVALDPFPFSGSATTCEALWMGVPVVTCPGETFASRHSLSHLSSVGFTETIARDWNEYVELAVSMAGDLPRLAALRAGLRERIAASPLCDGKRFANNLMRMLRKVWETRAG